MKFAGQAAKAIYAAVVAVIGSLGTALVGQTSISAITDAQWVTIAGAGVIAFGAVYGVTNRATAPAAAE